MLDMLDLTIKYSATVTDASLSTSYKKSRCANSQDFNEWLVTIGVLSRTIDWTADFLTVYGANELDSRQLGYSSGDSWGDQWQVIGDIISNPIIYIQERSDYPIVFAFHGQGSWRPLPLARSFRELSDILDAWCYIYYVEFGGSILDSDFSVRIEVLEKVKQRLGAILDENCLTTFVGAM
jgi:hypothetical protein